jgi:hypothetical protein
VARNERVVHFCRRPIRCARRRHRARVRRLPGLGVCSGSCAPAQPHCGPAPRTSCYKRSSNVALAPALPDPFVQEASCSRQVRKRARPIPVPRVATAPLLLPYPALAARLKPWVPCWHSLLLCVSPRPCSTPRERGARGSAEHCSRERHGPGGARSAAEIPGTGDGGTVHPGARQQLAACSHQAKTTGHGGSAVYKENCFFQYI